MSGPTVRRIGIFARRHFTSVYLIAGMALLGWVLADVEIAQVLKQVGAIGIGFLLVLAVYFAAFLIDTVTWHLAILSLPLGPRWVYRVWKTRMLGEAFNAVMPAAGMGGEPVKAIVLKRRYDVEYRDGTASLILARTINLMALIIFLLIGFVLIAQSPAMPTSYKMTAGIGLLSLGGGVIGFFFVQRLRLTSTTGQWLQHWALGRRLIGLLHHVQDMEDRLVLFYSYHKARFAWALALAFGNWLIGTVEVYTMAWLLGQDLSFAEAWIIEAFVQLVRAGTFFIPLSLGAQEGVFLLVCGALTGVPGFGIALAIIRRLRELVWIVWGFCYIPRDLLRRPSGADKEPADTNGQP